jgi:hypothetical protein
MDFSEMDTWGGLMLPNAPKARPRAKSYEPILPPLPPAPAFSIFDDDFAAEIENKAKNGKLGLLTVKYHNGTDSNEDSGGEEDEDDSSPEVVSHPDDVLKGVIFRAKLIDPKTGNVSELPAADRGDRADSLYLVYSVRSKMVKVGITLLTYEECREKYTKLYGALETFQFLQIDNGKNTDLTTPFLYPTGSPVSKCQINPQSNLLCRIDKSAA